MNERVYKNSTELMNLHGVPIDMAGIADACLYGRLNLFLQGDTGSGKTQLAKDAMGYFGTGFGDADYAKGVQEKYGEDLGSGTNVAIDATRNFPEDKSLFILGRNDMDTRELFQQINLGNLYQRPDHNLEPLINPDTGEVEFYYPKVDENGIFVYQKLSGDQADVVRKGLEKLAGSTGDIRELTSKINTNLIVVDELPNCVPAVRAQLFNLFDGFVEIDGRAYQIGDGYSVGIATGNIGQQFTESSNGLGRALRDRMHVTVDVDYFFPTPKDTLEILATNTDPRVSFDGAGVDQSEMIREQYEAIRTGEIPLEKLLVAGYLLHGLDHCSVGSKRKMKGMWPTELSDHEQGSDVGLVLPVSPRAAKSIVRLSQSLDKVALDSGADEETVLAGAFNSMMQAYKFVAAHSGVLNEAAVRNNYAGNSYEAMDAVIATTTTQFGEKTEAIAAGLEMVREGKLDKNVMDLFSDRWAFMKNTLEGLVQEQKEKGGK